MFLLMSATGVQQVTEVQVESRWQMVSPGKSGNVTSLLHSVEKKDETKWVSRNINIYQGKWLAGKKKLSCKELVHYNIKWVPRHILKCILTQRI